MAKYRKKAKPRTQPTEGPWELRTFNGNAKRLIISTKRDENGKFPLIADCWPDSPDDYGLPHTWEYQANADLLAAAQNMQKALRGLLDWGKVLGTWEAQCWRDAEDALAQSEGR